MQGNYVSIADFEQYKKTNASPALAVLDINLQNPNKLNQVAARMLGYSCYEALQPHHYREQRINNNLFFEACPFQNNADTIKAGNILVVFDKADGCIRFRALSVGEEAELVTDENQYTQIHLHHSVLGFSLKARATDASNRLCVDMTLLMKDGTKDKFLAEAIRTDKGVFFNLYQMNEAGEGRIHNEIAIAFDDADTEGYADVDQVGAFYRSTLASIDGEYYQWLMPTVTMDGMRYLNFNNDGEIILSHLMFDSYEDAVSAVQSRSWDYGPEDVEGAVIIKTTKTFAGKPVFDLPYNDEN